MISEESIRQARAMGVDTNWEGIDYEARSLYCKLTGNDYETTYPPDAEQVEELLEKMKRQRNQIKTLRRN